MREPGTSHRPRSSEGKAAPGPPVATARPTFSRPGTGAPLGPFLSAEPFARDRDGDRCRRVGAGFVGVAVGGWPPTQAMSKLPDIMPP